MAKKKIANTYKPLNMAIFSMIVIALLGVGFFIWWNESERAALTDMGRHLESCGLLRGEVSKTGLYRDVFYVSGNNTITINTMIIDMLPFTTTHAINYSESSGGGKAICILEETGLLDDANFRNDVVNKSYQDAYYRLNSGLKVKTSIEKDAFTMKLDFINFSSTEDGLRIMLY